MSDGAEHCIHIEGSYQYPQDGTAWFPTGMERTQNREALLNERQQPGNVDQAALAYEPGRLWAAYQLKQEGKMDEWAFKQESVVNAQGWHNTRNYNGPIEGRTYYDTDSMRARLQWARVDSDMRQMHFNAANFVSQIIYEPQQGSIFLVH